MENQKDLREALKKALLLSAEGIEGVVIQYSNGNVYGCSRDDFMNWGYADVGAKIIYSIKSIYTLGSQVTVDSIDPLIDDYFLPYWAGIVEEYRQKEEKNWA